MTHCEPRQSATADAPGRLAEEEGRARLEETIADMKKEVRRSVHARERDARGELRGWSCVA